MPTSRYYCPLPALHQRFCTWYQAYDTVYVADRLGAGGSAWALYLGMLASSLDVTRRLEIRRLSATHEQEAEFSSRV